MPGRLALASALLALSLLSACSDGAPTGLDGAGPDLARAPSGGQSGGGPKVSAADPDTGFRNTTITVQVLGSGFDQGSKAIWALNGDTAFATTKMRTNSTQYVSAKKLIANITIGADAPLDLYDIVVLTAGGKKGIGLELFAVTYQLIDLGTLGGPQSAAYGMNDLGQVVGTSQTATGQYHAFLWTPGFGMQDLGALGADHAEARDVNESGRVVGWRSGSGVGLRAFSWTAAEGMRDLDQFGGTFSQAFAINAAGEIGGKLGGEPWPLTIAALWVAGGYETVDGSIHSWGIHGLNDGGQAVGWAEPPGGTARPFLYTRTASGWTSMEIPVGQYDAYASSINAAGQVAGTFRGVWGFVWSATAGVDTLPALTAGARSDAYAINNAGIVVGDAYSSSDMLEKPVFWTRGADGRWTVHQLPRAGNASGIAYAINRNGDIAGMANVPGGQLHAVLWKLQ